MAGLIPQSFVNSLIERVDIVDVVGGRVQLKKAGSDHIGLCPFHDEKTPSFHVYPDGHYHCFGCEAHGTTLGFLMAIDNLPFPEAVESLAATLGLEVPREGGNERRADPQIYAVLTAANNQFQDWLRHHAERSKAVDYLKERGLTGAVARDFGIGFAPPGWQGLKTALGTFGEALLLDAGLLAKNDERQHLRPVSRSHRVPNPRHARSRHRLRWPGIRGQHRRSAEVSEFAGDGGVPQGPGTLWLVRSAPYSAQP